MHEICALGGWGSPQSGLLTHTVQEPHDGSPPQREGPPIHHTPLVGGLGLPLWGNRGTPQLIDRPTAGGLCLPLQGDRGVMAGPPTNRIAPSWLAWHQWMS